MSGMIYNTEEANLWKPVNYDYDFSNQKDQKKPVNYNYDFSNQKDEKKS